MGLVYLPTFTIEIHHSSRWNMQSSHGSYWGISYTVAVFRRIQVCKKAAGKKCPSFPGEILGLASSNWDSSLGQIIATSHDRFPPKCRLFLEGTPPLFEDRKSSFWWNIMIWPDGLQQKEKEVAEVKAVGKADKAWKAVNSLQWQKCPGCLVNLRVGVVKDYPWFWGFMKLDMTRTSFWTDQDSKEYFGSEKTPTVPHWTDP